MEKDGLVNKVCQDTNKIYARLFDHRPFLNGEVQHFVREFEEKKGNRDIETLLKSHQSITELCDLLSTADGPSTKETINQFIQNIKKTTSEIESISNSKRPVVEDPKLLEKEEQRKKKWQEFLIQQEAKLLSVDNTIKEKEEELKKHYQQLQDQLKKL